MTLIRLNPSDTVSIARTRLRAGDVVDGITLRDNIPAGHKVAIQDIAKGTTVRKYAQNIGTAAVDIQTGAHVHTHNLAFVPVDQNYAFGTNLCPPAPPEQLDTFMGLTGGRPHRDPQFHRDHNFGELFGHSRSHDC